MLKQLRCCSVVFAVAVAFAFCSHMLSPLCSHLHSPLRFPLRCPLRSPLRLPLRSHATCCTHLLTLSHCVCIFRSHTLSLPLSIFCRRAVADQLCVCLARGRSLSALRLCCCCFCCCSFVCFFLRFLCIFTVRCYQNAALSASQSQSQSPLWCFTLCSRRDVVIAIKCQCTCSCFSLVCVVTVYAYVCVCVCWLCVCALLRLHVRRHCLLLF